MATTSVLPDLNQDELKQKCKELKQKIQKVEDLSKISALEINRTKISVNRLRLEYSILLERLESRSSIHESSDVTDSEDYEISDKKVTKKKKYPTREQNPDLPKRPLNPYLVFCESEKDKFKKLADAEGRSHSELTKQLGEAWKSLDEKGKQPYVDLYNQDKERYKREMELYENGHTQKKLKTNNGDALDATSINETSNMIEDQEVEDEESGPKANRDSGKQANNHLTDIPTSQVKTEPQDVLGDEAIATTE